MKCLAISSSYPPDHAGGYELGACNLLESLAKHCGWQNIVVAAVRNKKSPKTHELQLTGFFPGKFGPGIALMQTRRKLRRAHGGICDQLKALAADSDLVVVFNPRRLVYPQWIEVLNTKTPVFAFVSDHWPADLQASDLFYSKSRGTLPSCYANVPSEEETLGKFKGVIFGSRFLEEKLSGYFPKSVSRRVLHWGIETSQFPSAPYAPERLKTLGFCGRPDPAKGLDLALDAFHELAVQDPELRLLIASDLISNTYGRSIIKRVHRDPVLKFRTLLLGQIPHAKLYELFYSQVGLLLFPSIWDEPFALTVLEAMASGCLVVGSNTGGTPEVLDETTGFLFDPKREGDLLEKCRIALKSASSHANLVQAGTARIQAMHTLGGMARQMDTWVQSQV